MEFDQYTNPTMDDLKLDDSITHVVIQLSGIEFRERFIRLVPRLWIDKAHGKWVCLYPQKKDSTVVEEWVKKSLPPRADFNLYEVEILIKTKSFEEGERALSEVRNVENDEKSSNCTQAKKRPRYSEDFHVKDEDEALYNEDNSVYIRHSPLRLTPDFTQSTRRGSTENSEKNSNESIEQYLDKRLEDIENRIMSKIESMNRSIINHLNKKVDEILNAVTSNTEAAILETSDTNNAMDIKLPVEDMTQFSELSKIIRQNNEKEKSMKVFLYRAQRGSYNLKTSLSKMLKSTMTKAVQLKFSGQGRKVKGRGKENFSATPLFNCIDHVLSNIFPDVGKAEILSATTRWFSGAADRDGGKKMRSMDVQVLPKTEPIDDPLALAGCDFS